MDRIEFRAVENESPGGPDGATEPAVEVLINDVPLGLIWSRAGGSETTPLWSGDAFFGGRSLWGESPAVTGDHELWAPVDAGRVAVLTCTCGCFPCGGASARIDFTTDIVTWTDFHESHPHKEPVDVGPFTFAREQYETALRSV